VLLGIDWNTNDVRTALTSNGFVTTNSIFSGRKRRASSSLTVLLVGNANTDRRDPISVGTLLRMYLAVLISSTLNAL